MREASRFRSDEEYDNYMDGYRDCESDILDIMKDYYKHTSEEFVKAVVKHMDITSTHRMNEGHRRLRRSLDELVEAAKN